MRNLKRVLTLVMAVAMMMSLLVVGASAKFNDQDKIENVDAVNINVALGIIKGRDTGDFDPTGNVTRAEMAKMIAVALNGGKEPTLGTLITPTYKDIKGHWAEGYIEYCTTLGIVAGMGDGTFAPNANVTATQAAKMLLVAMGYDAVQEKFNGTNWSVNINVRASQKGLYSELAIDPNAPLNRDNAAQMVANALEADMVEYEYKLTTVNGQIQSSLVLKNRTEVTILTEKFKLETAYGVMTKASYNSTDKEYDYSFDPAGITGKDKVPSNAISATSDYSNLFAQQVRVLYKNVNNKTTVYGMYAYKSKVVTAGVADDLGTSTKSGEIKFDGKFYKAEDSVNALTLGASTNDPADIVAIEFNNATPTTTFDAVVGQYNVTLLDVDGDGKVDTVTYLPYTVKKVTYVGSKSFNAGAPYNFDDVVAYKGVAKDDFVKIVAAANTVSGDDTFTKIDTVLSGKVTATKLNSDGDKISMIQVGGTWYSLVTALVTDTTTFKAKTNVAKAPVVNGFVFEADTSVVATVTDYAVVDSAVGSYANGMNGHQAKLLFADGTKKVVDTTANYSNLLNKDEDANPATLVGKLVKFDINSDKEYTLTDASTLDGTPGNEHGFDGYLAAPSATRTNDFTKTSGGAVKQIDGKYVADDATIFLNDNGSYKVITGATLNRTAVGNTTIGLLAKNVYWMTTSSNGYDTITMAFIDSNASISSADKQFGYVISKTVNTTNTDGDPCSLITIWNGSKEVTLETKGNLTVAATVAKGDIIDYTLNKDGKVDAVNADAVSTTVGSEANFGAIRSYNGKDEVVIAMGTTPQLISGKTINVSNLTSGTKTFDIKSDTVIIYIDADGVAGVEGAGIELATKTADSTYAYANVYFQSSAGDLTLLVIDARNDILVQQ